MFLVTGAPLIFALAALFAFCAPVGAGFWCKFFLGFTDVYTMNYKQQLTHMYCPVIVQEGLTDSDDLVKSFQRQFKIANVWACTLNSDVAEQFGDVDKTSGRILGFESREKPTGRNPLEGSEYVGGGLECQGLEDVTFKDVSYLKNALFFRSSKVSPADVIEMRVNFSGNFGNMCATKSIKVEVRPGDTLDNFLDKIAENRSANIVANEIFLEHLYLIYDEQDEKKNAIIDFTQSESCKGMNIYAELLKEMAGARRAFLSVSGALGCTKKNRVFWHDDI